MITVFRLTLSLFLAIQVITTQVHAYVDAMTDKQQDIVIGFYPHWSEDTYAVPWKQLTHVAFYASKLQGDGTLVDYGWNTFWGEMLQNHGAAYDVPILLSIVCQEPTQLHSFLGNSSLWNASITTIVEEMEKYDAQGIVLDLVGMETSYKEEYVAFVTSLNNRLKQSSFHTLSIMIPAIDYHEVFDIPALLAHSDTLIIMGTDYHWAEGLPGPVAPLNSGNTWTSHSIQWTLEQYVDANSDAHEKFILGIAFSGIVWPTSNDSVPCREPACETLASGSTTLLHECQQIFSEHGSIFDSEAQSPYIVYNDNGWLQLFCENPQSIAAKLDLLQQHEMGGAAVWALSYEGSNNKDLWQEFAQRFNAEQANHRPIADAGTDTIGYVGETIYLDASASTDVDNDPLLFVWQQIHGPQIQLVQSNTKIASFTPEQTGIYQFQLIVTDADLVSDPDTVMIDIKDVASSNPDNDDHNTDKSSIDDSDGCNCQSHSANTTMWIFLFLIAVTWAYKKWRRT